MDGTGSGGGTTRFKIVAICLMAVLVSSPTWRHGAAAIGLLSIAKISRAVSLRRSSVVILGNGTTSGKNSTVSAIRTLRVAGM